MDRNDQFRLADAIEAPLASGADAVNASTRPGLPHSGGSAASAAPLRAMLRHRWTILVTALLVGAPAIVWVWTTERPEYRARATVEISPINPRVLYRTEENGLIPMYQQYLDSQVGIIAGNRMLERVLSNPTVRQTDWYRNPPKKLWGVEAAPVERLREGLTVRTRGRTFLIDIDFVAFRPDDAKVIAEAFLYEYRAEARERINATEVELLEALDKTLEGLDTRIAAAEQITEELRRDLGTDMPEELISQKRLQLFDLESKLGEVQRELELATWQQEQLDETKAAGTEEAADPDALAAEAADPVEEDLRKHLEGDPEWWRLNLALQDARRRLEVEGQRLGSEHMTMVKLREEVRQLESELAARGARVEEIVASEDPSVVVETPAGVTQIPETVLLARRVERLTKEKELLLGAFSAAQTHFGTEFEKARQLTKESEKLARIKSKAEFVRTRLDEKETERGPAAVIREVSAPQIPATPYRDRRILMTGMALAAAVGSGVGLALLRGMSRRTYFEVDQLVTQSHTPLLGSVPLVEERDLKKLPDLPLINDECFRVLRTSVLSRFDGKVILITSSRSGVGKTTVAATLAKSLARCGKKTLLLDGDIRAAMVARRLGLSNAGGLLAALRGEATIQDVTVETDTPNLFVIPAGESDSQQDLELLANGAFSTYLKMLRESYDVILIDSPPVMPFADARILARHADGTVVVVREGLCRLDEVMGTIASISHSGGRLLGTVYVGRNGHSRHYGYGYSYGYGYGYGYGKSHAYGNQRGRRYDLDVRRPVSAGSERDAT